jgi:CelD/BcsL family acetyltransferase involved in cellulose biosynthesis
MKTATPVTIYYQVLTEVSEVATISSEWTALLMHSTCNRAFSSPEWFLAACKVTPSISPYVIVARRDTSIVGILPLAVKSNGEDALFPTPLSDYNDIIVSYNDIFVAAELLDYAISNPRGYHKIVLEGIRKESNCARAVKLLAPDYNLEQALHKESCPYLLLPTTYDEYLTTRSANFRGSLKRKQKRARENNIIISQLEPNHFPAHQIAENFLFLHLSRMGSRSCFNVLDHQAFVKEVFPALFMAKKMHVLTLLVKEKILGIHLCMMGDNSLCFWNGGFAQEVECYAPGKLLMDAAIKSAYAMGLEEYDLLHGTESYKIKWANTLRYIGKIELTCTYT